MRKATRILKIVLMSIVATITVATIGFGIYGIWSVGKRISYSMQYEDMVKETVRQMVKEEALK